MGIGIFRRLDDFLPRGVRSSVADILIHGSDKQIDVLLYHSDVVAQTL